MQQLSQGVLIGSRIYFHSPSPASKEIFFHPLCIGQYFCDSTYQVCRNSYESFLIIFVLEGEGSIRLDKKILPLYKNQIALIDCYAPHFYQTEKGWNILWIHFDGPVCRSYYNLIVKEYGNIITLNETVTLRNFNSMFSHIFNCFAHDVYYSEAELSKYITDLLTTLIAPSSTQVTTPNTLSPTAQSMSYIRSHFTKDISVNNLADQVALSPYYFIRLFKKETGKTPHQYILEMRINSSKFYLRTTNSSIQEIAFACGFKSLNNFCICFKNIVNMTPTEYRSLAYI